LQVQFLSPLRSGEQRAEEVVAEDREQDDQAEERDGAARPVTAAARRERRASARTAAERDRTATSRGAERTSASSQARTRRVRPAEADGDKSDKKAAVAASTLEKKGRPTPKRDRRDKQPNVFVRLLRFLREVVAELRKVIWPTRKQEVTYTVVVLVFVAFVVAVVYGLDLGFSKLVFTVFA
jgi:preprotein translocase subunit SecE